MVAGRGLADRLGGTVQADLFRLAGQGATWSMATHDARLSEALLLALGPTPVEQLLGVRPQRLAQLRRRGIPTRISVPFGGDWFRYCMRRVAESRGAS